MPYFQVHRAICQVRKPPGTSNEDRQPAYASTLILTNARTAFAN
jgi:hypothetical protein